MAVAGLAVCLGRSSGKALGRLHEGVERRGKERLQKASRFEANGRDGFEESDCHFCPLATVAPPTQAQRSHGPASCLLLLCEWREGRIK